MRDVVAGKPSDVATRETANFLASRLPVGVEMLEVGCGKGHVAFELLRRGYRVIGLDSDPELVAKVQERGVTAIVASWPEFESAPVDAIAFTRSLHHINPLRAALDHARRLIRPAGLLLLEDFAFDQGNKATLDWFQRVLVSEPGRRLIRPVAGRLVSELLGGEDPMAIWHDNHDHGVHSITAMSRAIAEYFSVRETQSVPYFYRYLIPALEETPKAAAFVEEVFQEEARLGKQGEIALIGRRVVASS